MAIQFNEVVITAPFLVVKGFLMGYMQGRREQFAYFFHRKHGIKHEAFSEMVREFLHSTCRTHLCLPEDVLPDFEQALQNVEEKIGARIESKKRINRAEFSFSFHIYDESLTAACKELFASLPPGVELLNFAPLELAGETAVAVAEFSQIHQYCYEGNGLASGDFEGVMNFFLAIKRHSLKSQILCSEIRLNLEQEQKPVHTG